MSPPQEGPSKRSIYLRAGIFVLFIAGVIALRWTPVADYLDEERLMTFLADLREFWWTPLAFIGLFVAVATAGLPVTPVVLAGAAVFGFVKGVVLITVAMALGSGTGFFVANLLGRDLVLHLSGGRLRHIEKILDQHAFWPLIQVRFMPIPFAMINYGAALAGVQPAKFMLATGLALVPSTVVHTYFLTSLLEQADRRPIILAQYIATLAVFNALISFPQIRTWWRYRQKKAQES